MKKISVIVQDRTTLKLTENAEIGDIIDLKELTKVDNSYIDSVIESGQDKVYESRLAELKRTLSAEKEIAVSKLNNEIKTLQQQNENNLKIKENEIHNLYQKEINDLKNEIGLLKNQHDSALKLKEKDISENYLNQINELKKEIEVLKSTKSAEIDALDQNNKLKIAEIKNQEEDKYKKLKNDYDILLSKQESLLKQKELELQNKYTQEIANIKNDHNILLTKKESEINSIKEQAKLELEQKLNKQKEDYTIQIREKENVINELQHQKSIVNVKQTGDNLENWCYNEITSYMQNGLFNCRILKDTKAVKEEGEEKATKADYIFKIYSNDKREERDLLTSVCLEMKDENPDTKKKQTNESHFKKLNQDREKKNCKYAVLVSNLEMDKPNIIPIYKVREYEDMYVVRPAYLMVFLNMICSLTARFANLITSDEKAILELKSKQDLIDEFDKIKNTYLEKPLKTLNDELENISKQSENIKNAASQIDYSCSKIITSYIEKINDKINNFELKSKGIIKKLD